MNPINQAFRDIDVALLRSFLAIQDHHGFTRASQAVGRSQSAVSMQMRRLEAVVGAPIFHRDGRKTRLTAHGETLLGYARQMVALNDRTLEALTDARIEGTARLAVMDDYATIVLPDLLKTFTAIHPGVRLEITTGFTLQLLPGLGDEFDLVLTTQPAGTGGEVLRSERVRWAFSRRDPLPDLSREVPLATHPLGSLFRNLAVEALSAANMRWRVVLTSSSLSATEAIAAAGIAVTLVKEGTARADLRFLGAEEGLPDLPQAEIALHRVPAGRNKAADKLADFLTHNLAR